MAVVAVAVMTGISAVPGQSDKGNGAAKARRLQQSGGTAPRIRVCARSAVQLSRFRLANPQYVH